ncbi:MAG: protein kinase domain-containing protein [Solirubrobacteraceae bacterium]
MPEAVRTVGRYGILRELGRGGMAVVYLARQVDLDRLVALKELAAFHAADADFARRFVRESRLAGSLVHPNVITVFDYFEDAGTPYIAMEYVDRGSLRPYVGRMTLAQIGGVLDGLLAGLAEAEEHAIVHRDLKPENLMVTSTGTVKIADFGIAKATQAADTGAFVTATGTTVGTPPYMAPEQAMAKEIGPWTDLYSVGCMAYELFTGRPPFYDAEEPLAILLRHISEALPPASEVADVDPDISAWIERLTSKDPKDRPQSATIAWEEFEEILIGKLGPRWRRDSRLPEPPNPALGGAPVPPLAAPPAEDSDEWHPATPVPGPATPPPTGPAPPMDGIDFEGTGPDTPLPSAEESAYETYHTPPSGPPVADEPEPEAAEAEPVSLEPAAPEAAEPEPEPEPEAAEPESQPEPEPAAVAPTTPVPTPVPARLEQELAPPSVPPEPDTRGGGDAPVPPRVVVLARGGAIALLAALLIPVLTEGADRWNVFAVLSPFEAAGIALATWLVARALSAARVSVPVAAGALIGFGGLTLIASGALLRFTINRLDAIETLLAVVVLLGAVATLAAGVGCLRASDRSAPAATVDPGPLVLGLAGIALAGVAIFTNYDGFSSLWIELSEGYSAEFVFEPVVVVGAGLVGLGLLGGQPRVAAGLLLAVGTAASLHYLGVIVAAWRAIGEVGEIKAAGFIGVLGGLMIVAAGAWVSRAGHRER